MTWPEFIRRVADRCGTTQVEARRLLETTFDEVALAARDSPDGLLVPGFGRFRRSTRKARAIRNPATRELMRLPLTETVVLRAAKALKRKAGH